MPLSKALALTLSIKGSFALKGEKNVDGLLKDFSNEN